MTDERLEKALQIQRDINEAKNLIRMLTPGYIVPLGDHKNELDKPDSIQVSYYGGQGISIYNNKYFKIEFISIMELVIELDRLEKEFIKA